MTDRRDSPDQEAVTTTLLSDAEHRALRRLLAKARGSTRLSAMCAAFLLAWFFPADAERIDLSLFAWGLAPSVASDLTALLGLIIRLQSLRLPHALIGYASEFRSLLLQWHPEAFGLPARVPSPAAIRAFRRRHDLSQHEAASALHVDRPTFAAWERGQEPMPALAWQTLRMHWGESRHHSRVLRL